MQLDELTQERSIGTISKKTNLPVSVINNLFNKNFASFNKVQAMGAISIIEREFDINLGVLREECKYHFKENPPVEMGVSVIQPIVEEKPLIPKIVMLILLALIAYGAWYFYSEYYNKKITLSNGINRSVLVDEDLRENGSEVTQEKSSAEEVVESKTSDVSEASPADTRSISYPEAPKDVEKSVEVDKVPMKVVEVASIEDNNTQAEDQTKPQELTLVINTPKSDEAKADVADEVINNTQTDDTALESEEAVVAKKIITLVPGEDMWFRLIDLKTKKRREYKRIAEYHIDMRENDWLFAAQNVDFSFRDNDKTAVYGGRGKLFYKLDQQGIHKLNEQEYRKLSK